MTAVSALQNSRQWARIACLLHLISLCLVMLLGFSATAQSQNDRFAPQDVVEIRIRGWGAFRLSDVFTIGSSGTLDLPIIGSVPAAGLHPHELASLIGDRLQAISGLKQRPVTTVQRKPSAVAPDRAKVTTGSSALQTTVDRSRTAGIGAAEGLETKQPEHKEVALLLDLSVALAAANEARGQALTARQAAEAANRDRHALASERQRVVALNTELAAALASLEALKARTAQAAKATTVRPTKLVAQSRVLERRQRARAVLAQSLVAARKAITELKSALQSAKHQGDEAIRREQSVRNQIDAIERTKVDARTQAQAHANALAQQERTLDQRRKEAEGLVRELALVRREVQELKAKAVRDGHAYASLTEARRERDEARGTVERFKRDLTAAHRTINDLQVKANGAAATQQGAVQARQIAEANEKRAGQTLATERERAHVLARALDHARLERDTTAREFSRVSAAQREALQKERDKNLGLTRDLIAAGKTIDSLKARIEHRGSRLEQTPKTRTAKRASRTATAVAKTVARPRGASQSRETRKLEVHTQRPVRLTTIALPDALLPTRSRAIGR
jgi:hypothetical protein